MKHCKLFSKNKIWYHVSHYFKPKIAIFLTKLRDLVAVLFKNILIYVYTSRLSVIQIHNLVIPILVFIIMKSSSLIISNEVLCTDVEESTGTSLSNDVQNESKTLKIIVGICIIAIIAYFMWPGPGDITDIPDPEPFNAVDAVLSDVPPYLYP